MVGRRLARRRQQARGSWRGQGEQWAEGSPGHEVPSRFWGCEEYPGTLRVGLGPGLWQGTDLSAPELGFEGWTARMAWAAHAEASQHRYSLSPEPRALGTPTGAGCHLNGRSSLQSQL